MSAARVPTITGTELRTYRDRDQPIHREAAEMIHVFSDRQRITRPTVKTHLERIFLKTR